MASRLKEDEKNEKIIRGLLKLPENKRCINCNSLGPQYVCTSFWTFVCTNCSGIHREFTHRVKSISMAKFSSEEVRALQEGGNRCAKEIYLKGWDSQRQSLPDGRNIERLRGFIRHVYVDRRYTGDKNYDKPPRAKMGDKGESYDNRSQSGPRSPQYEDANERRYSGRSSPGGRSPGYEPDTRQYGNSHKSPSRLDVVNDWRREDRFANGKKFGDLIEEESKLEGRSPERAKDGGSSSPSVGRPVREILEESTAPPRIAGPPKADGGMAANGSTHTQRTASSSSLGSINENPPEVVKSESTVSLIDFDADPEPLPKEAAAVQAQPTPLLPQPVVQQPTASLATDNWAAFDISLEPKVSQFPSKANTLDSILSELSVPATAPNQTSGASSIPTASVVTTQLPGSANPSVAFGGHTPFGSGASTDPFVSSFSTLPNGIAVAATPGHLGSAQWPNIQHQLPSSNQPWNTSFASNSQGPLSTPAVQPPQSIPNPLTVPTSSNAQPSAVEVNSGARKALPEDLFAATYLSFPAQMPGWHSAPRNAMGFNMQYNGSMPLPTLQQPKSSNPFDLGSEAPLQTKMTMQFPSVASLHDALPNVSAPSGLLHTSRHSVAPPTWMPSQPLPHPSGMPPQASGFPSAPSPSYMPTQTPGGISPFSHPGSFSNNEVSPGTLNTDQQLAGTFSSPANPHPFSSVGGNPFG